MPTNRKPYPSDVSDEEWAFVAPYLVSVREDAPQRTHDLREVFNGLRWIVRAGASWRMLPHDLPPWQAVYQQTQRWLSVGVFEAMVHVPGHQEMVEGTVRHRSRLVKAQDLRHVFCHTFVVLLVVRLSILLDGLA